MLRDATVAALIPLATWLPAFDLTSPTPDLKLSLGFRLQTRLEYADAHATDGGDWDIWAANKPDPDPAKHEKTNDLNLMLRRGRIWLDGVFQDDLHFHFQLRADTVGSSDSGGTRDAEILYWFSDYRFWHDDAWAQKVRVGRFCRAFAIASYDSNGTLLLPTQRPSACFDVDAQAIGVSWLMEGPQLYAEAGVAEGEGTALTDSDDWWLYARGQYTLIGSYHAGSRTETFLGAEGTDLLLGCGVARRLDGNDDGDASTTLVADTLLHLDRWSACLDLVYRHQEQGSQATADQYLISLQAGYAIPLASGRILEPAVRLARVDLDTADGSERTAYVKEGLDPATGQGSGWHADVGLNWYLVKHTHKIQFDLEVYRPEAGDGDAFIARIQHQIQF